MEVLQFYYSICRLLLSSLAATRPAASDEDMVQAALSDGTQGYFVKAECRE
jgi:hypothetical protein